MAHIQRNGIGAVMCDECHAIIEFDIDYAEYKDEYHTKESNLCDRCLKQITQKEES